MKKSEFIEKLKESLETEDHLNEDTDLRDLDSYDSLSMLSIIVLIDETFHKKLNADQLKSISTIKSLMDLIGKDNFSN